jgi:hypothetical protein
MPGASAPEQLWTVSQNNGGAVREDGISSASSPRLPRHGQSRRFGTLPGLRHQRLAHLRGRELNPPACCSGRTSPCPRAFERSGCGSAQESRALYEPSEAYDGFLGVVRAGRELNGTTG